jgi:6-phosphogluconolactonase
MNIHVHPSVDDLAHRAATIIESAISTHDDINLGVAGGSTPRLVHGLLAERPIDWNRVTAWMTDERWVEPDHPDSNQQMVRETLADLVDVRFLAPDTTLHDPATSAAAYEATLVGGGIGSERHSIVMLGLGTDGHTASLFPGTEALRTTGRSYVANWVPDLGAWRLTATYDLLALADRVMFLVTGEGKAEVMARIASGEEYPASAVTSRGEVEWLVDREAASLL